MMRMAVAFLCGALALSGCADAPEEDLQSWMLQLRNAQPPAVKPVEPPKRFDPQPYAAQGAVDPFVVQRLLGASRGEAVTATGSAQLFEREQSRRKDQLESYPLDALSMVGSLRKGGKQVALMKVDKLIYQVQAGEHMGQNFGKVIKVTDTEVVLREIVQDAAGEWIERQTSMQLQEGAK